MPIDTSVVGSDGWTLQRLYRDLRKQQANADLMWKRYIGDGPLPPMNENQRAAVQWFVKKARTNFERLIVRAVLSRLSIRGIRTAADDDEGGDAEAFATWKRSRGKLWSKEAHKYALTMGRGFVMVGRHPRNGRLLVTAEDPRHVVIQTDPADPFRVESALKLVFEPANNRDVAYLFRLVEEDGKEHVLMRMAVRSRSNSTPVSGYQFDAGAFEWAPVVIDGESYEAFEPPWLQEGDDDQEAMLPIVPFVNEDGMAEFEPHIEALDRITQQILQRMTIATVQAFKQRAFKGLPKTDPETGEEINYDEIFVADPGAIWDIPESVEIWESGEVNMQGILLAIRDDIKDLAAVSGTPLYNVNPDAAQGSAEGASLQRETLTFKVKDRQDWWGLSHERVAELIFRTEGEDERADAGGIEIMWAPADLPSMSERANAIAQTKGVVPVYLQLTEIWGLDPATADRAMTMVQEDNARNAAFAQASAPPPAAREPAPTRGAAPREQRATEPPRIRPVG